MKKTKKILALLLAAVMVVGLSVLAFAADEEDPTFSVTADKASLAVGEEVTLAVKLDKEIADVGGMQYNLHFDDALVEYVDGSATLRANNPVNTAIDWSTRSFDSATEPEMTRGTNYEGDTTYYRISFADTMAKGFDTTFKAGTVMTVKFKALSAVEDVAEAFSLEGYILVSTSVTGMKEIPVNIISRPTVEETVDYGDANGDGVVDMSDITLLMQYMANYDYDTGTSTMEVGAGADANGDGTVDMSDITLLMQYMANYDYDTGSSTVVLGPKN
jgi:hypothetical protein